MMGDRKFCELNPLLFCLLCTDYYSRRGLWAVSHLGCRFELCNGSCNGLDGIHFLFGVVAAARCINNDSVFVAGEEFIRKLFILHGICAYIDVKWSNPHANYCEYLSVLNKMWHAVLIFSCIVRKEYSYMYREKSMVNKTYKQHWKTYQRHPSNKRINKSYKKKKKSSNPHSR